MKALSFDQFFLQDFAWPFYKPVDHKALGLDDYPKIIKSPMDLGTIQRKFESFAYADVAGFEADMGLMYKNCFEYNGADSDVVVMATRVMVRLCTK